MRLQIVFDDRVGIAMAVLNSLARHNINMTAGDIVTQNDGRGSFYLHAAQMTLDELHRVLPEIRQVPGVRDVRPIPLMPGERKQSELRTLLGALPAPVLSVDLEGRVVVANESAQRLLKLKGPDGQGTPLAPLVEEFDLVEHINRLDRPEYGVRLALRGQAVLADFIPVLVPLARAGKSLSGAVMVLHGGSLEAAAHEYFLRSEQIPTQVRLAVGEEFRGGDGPNADAEAVSAELVDGGVADAGGGAQIID